MYLAAMHHFFKDFWSKAKGRRSQTCPRDLIDPQLYSDIVTDFHKLWLPGLQAIHLGVAIIPAQQAQSFVSSTGAIKGTLKAAQEDRVEFMVWGVDDRGVYYELSKSYDYLLALAAKLKKETNLDFWAKLTAEQKKHRPADGKPILAHVHPEFALALADLDPNDYSQLLTQGYAFVELTCSQVYQQLEQVRHNDWNQAYLWVQANESFEVDFAQDNPEDLRAGSRLWEQDLEEALETSNQYFAHK
ncbi:hypothetical protein CJP74_01400 [Psittacicella melopsittaci]|uniref:Uncharacterized protein n=1 Tax=Psittacicella melopsittaci TaxID=2028576 RepID=A0A3A1Y811_9GAMM|nr:hypothetical protein [Psittacicella melopsittaci]RIY33671.1 hypothetical protein CJP74_01400 [Psittacicella melopsittaci]